MSVETAVFCGVCKMAVETFSWLTEVDPTGDINYLTRSAKFGDGYGQEVADGINNKQMMWNVTFFQENAVITLIEAFLDSHQGYRAFYWTPPNGIQGLYVCKKFTRIPHGGLYSDLTATFEQRFSP